MDLLMYLCFIQEADEAKQKSEAKNINLRKRKALSDLFKSLAEIGKATNHLVQIQL